MNGSIFINNIIESRQDEDALEQNRTGGQRKESFSDAPELSGYIAP